MRSVNRVVLIGNLTRNPELKQTANNQAVCTFGVATNRDWVNKAGDKQSLAEFHEVVAWSRLAEICHEFLKKGNLVYVEGYLKTRSWEGTDGQKRFRTEIVVEDMIRLEKRPTDDGINSGPIAASDNFSQTLSENPGGSAETAFGEDSALADTTGSSANTTENNADPDNTTPTSTDNSQESTDTTTAPITEPNTTTPPTRNH